MATVNEKLPAFTEKDYQPAKMRQMVSILERRLDSMEREISTASGTGGVSNLNREMAFFLGR